MSPDASPNQRGVFVCPPADRPSASSSMTNRLDGGGHFYRPPSAPLLALMSGEGGHHTTKPRFRPSPREPDAVPLLSCQLAGVLFGAAMDYGTLANAAGIPMSRAMRWAEPVSQALKYAGIKSRNETAGFLAQVGHESGSFQHVREIWGPTQAQKRYEGRLDLGNTQPGDGSRYRGRGLIQITGRANYTRIAARLRRLAAPDFAATPEALESPQWAALSAADYWLDRKLSQYFLPDGGVKFKALTKAINGGLNGYDDRLMRYERAMAALGGA